METKIKTQTPKVKVPVQDKKVTDAHRSILSKTEASEQQLRRVIASEVENTRIRMENLYCTLNENMILNISYAAKESEKKMKEEFNRTFFPVVVLFGIVILLQFAILVN